MTYGMELNPMQAIGYQPAFTYGMSDLAPQGAFGNFFSGLAPTLGGMVGGALGQRQLGTAIGQGAAPLLRLLPFQADPMAAAYGGGQLAPQGWFGNLISGLAPVAGRAVGGGVGQAISTIGGLGRFLPFDVDPVTAAYASGQLAPQGWFGNLISGLAPVAGRAVGGGVGQAISTIGGLGRFLPFDVDPVTAAYASGQLAPQGWFGNLISGLAPVAGRAIGGGAGQAISAIGGLGRYLPFEVDPMTAAYASGQLAPQSLFGNLLPPTYSGMIADGWGQRPIQTPIYSTLPRMLPFEASPMASAYGQLAPQGLFGGILGGIGGGLAGRAIGNLFGGSGGRIGNQVGNALGGIVGGLLPFQVDPLTAAYGAQYA